MFGIGAGELVIILIAGLIIFGPGKLPEIGRAIGKGLREFRKAQAAFSATLDEVSLESDKKDTSTTAEKNSSTEKVSLEKKAVEKIPEEKISVNEQPPHSALTVDDVINLAKQNPISKENVNEKNQEAIQTALKNNPGLQRTEKEIQTAEESLKIAKGNKGVSVSASSGSSFSKTEGSDDSEYISARVRGSLPIYSGNKLESQIKYAEIGIDAAKLQFLQEQENLIYNVATAYVNALENRATEKVNLQTESNLAEHEKNIAAMYDAGATAKIDLLRAQVETSNAAQDTAKSHAAYEVSLTNLATLMALNSISNLTVEEILPASDLDELENYIALADENRADLKADELKTEQGELNVEIARAAKRPTVSAEVDTGLGTQFRNWHLTPDISAGVSASWNIFDSGITKAQIREAEIEVERLRLAMQNDINSVHESVITAHKNLKIALMRLRNIATEKYKAGEGILLDILDAEVALSTAKKNHVSAMHDVIRYRFDLAYATGNTLSAMNVNVE